MRLLLLLVMLAGCGDDRPTVETRDSGDDDDDVTDAGDDASEGDAGDADADAGDDPAIACPVVGTFRPQAIFCDDMDITETVLANVTTATATVTLGGDGACEIELLTSGPECLERIHYRSVVHESLISDLESEMGIDACEPTGCTFGADDLPCALGDRAGTTTETLVLHEGGFGASRQDEGALCGAEVVTRIEWVSAD